MSEVLTGMQGPHHLPETAAAATLGPGAQTRSETAASMECRCPVEEEFHQWREIHSELLPLQVQEAYNLVFVHEKFMLDVLAARKTNKYATTPWAPEQESGSHKRVVTYVMSLNASLGPKSSNITETQVLSSCNRAGEVYIVASEVCNEGVPLADSFSILLHICLLRATPPDPDSLEDPALARITDWCRYSCHSKIKYKKNVWGMLKGQVERNAYSGMEGVHKDVSSALREHVMRRTGELGSPPRGGGLGVMQARRKRRTRTSSTDFAVRARKWAQQREHSACSSLFVNAVFMSLIVLLLAVNVLLYQRVLSLESYALDGAGGSSSHSEQQWGGLGPDEAAAKLKEMLSSVEGGGVWVQVARLLDRQEKLYFQELQELTDHLRLASHALTTADQELNAVLEHLPKTVVRVLEAVRQQEQQGAVALNGEDQINLLHDTPSLLNAGNIDNRTEL